MLKNNQRRGLSDQMPSELFRQTEEVFFSGEWGFSVVGQTVLKIAVFRASENSAGSLFGQSDPDYEQTEQ